MPEKYKIGEVVNFDDFDDSQLPEGAAVIPDTSPLTSIFGKKQVKVVSQQQANDYLPAKGRQFGTSAGMGILNTIMGGPVAGAINYATGMLDSPEAAAGQTVQNSLGSAGAKILAKILPGTSMVGALGKGALEGASYLGSTKAGNEVTNALEQKPDAEKRKLSAWDYGLSSLPIVGAALEAKMRNTSSVWDHLGLNKWFKENEIPTRSKPPDVNLQTVRNANTIAEQASKFKPTIAQEGEDAFKAEQALYEAKQAAKRAKAELPVARFDRQNAAQDVRKARGNYLAEVDSHYDNLGRSLDQDINAASDLLDERKLASLARDQNLDPNAITRLKRQTGEALKIKNYDLDLANAKMDLKHMGKGTPEAMEQENEIRRIMGLKTASQKRMIELDANKGLTGLANNVQGETNQLADLTTDMDLRKTVRELQVKRDTYNSMRKYAKNRGRIDITNPIDTNEPQKLIEARQLFQDKHAAYQTLRDDMRQKMITAQDLNAAADDQATLVKNLSGQAQNELARQSKTAQGLSEAGNDKYEFLNRAWRNDMAGKSNPMQDTLPTRLSNMIQDIRTNNPDPEPVVKTLLGAFFRDLVTHSSDADGSLSNLPQVMERLDRNKGIDTIHELLSATIPEGMKPSHARVLLDQKVADFYQVVNTIAKRGPNGRGLGGGVPLNNFLVYEGLANLVGRGMAFGGAAANSVFHKIDVGQLLAKAVGEPREVLMVLKNLEKTGTQNTAARTRAIQQLVALTGSEEHTPTDTQQRLWGMSNKNVNQIPAAKADDAEYQRKRKLVGLD